MNKITASFLALAFAALPACKPKAIPSGSTAAASPTATPAAADTTASVTTAEGQSTGNAGGAGRRQRGQGGAGGGGGGAGGGAGGRADFAERAKARFEQMKADLALTDDQAQKVNAIMEQQTASMQTLRSDQSMDRDARMAKFKESREAFGAQVEALLTPEQKVKWTELQQKREAERAARGANRPQQGGGAPAAQQ